MPQSSVLAFHSCHIGFTNNVVFRVNKLGVNTVTITNPYFGKVMLMILLLLLNSVNVGRLLISVPISENIDTVLSTMITISVS